MPSEAEVERVKHKLVLDDRDIQVLNEYQWGRWFRRVERA